MSSKSTSGSFIRRLQATINAITADQIMQDIRPEAIPETSETHNGAVCGTLNDGQKRLYTAFMRCVDRVMTLADEFNALAETIKDDRSLAAVKSRLSEIRDRGKSADREAKIVRMILWLSLIRDFGLMDAGDVRILPGMRLAYTGQSRSQAENVSQPNILDEIVGVMDRLTPDQFVEPALDLNLPLGATVVGDMTEDHKRLFTLLDQVTDGKHDFGLGASTTLLGGLIRDIMFYSIDLEFGLLDCPTTSVGRGFKVGYVNVPTDPIQAILNALGHAGGVVVVSGAGSEAEHGLAGDGSDNVGFDLSDADDGDEDGLDFFGSDEAEADDDGDDPEDDGSGSQTGKNWLN